MRISDWSSDVCSSDLPHLPLRQVQQRHHGRLLPPRRIAGDDGLHLVGVFRSPAEIAPACADFRLIGNMGSLAHRSHSPNTTSIAPNMAVASASMWPPVILSIKIGKASGWERVCQ